MVNHFDGFEDPKENWSKLPHALIDALPSIKTLGEFKVIVYILRHTWGFKDDSKKITLEEFAKGRKRKDGTRIDEGVGMSIPSIRKGIELAIEHGFIIRDRDDRDKARMTNTYSLKMKVGERNLHPDQGVGERNLHPGCKEVSAGVKESLPRTEKETLERNPEKENDSPSLREQAKNGEMTVETEIALLTQFGRQGKAGVADPSQDDAQWLRYREDALNIFVAEGGDLGKKQNEITARKNAILGFVSKHPEFDLKRWADSIHTCVIVGGVQPDNLGCIFDTYDHGGDYQEFCRDRRGSGKRSALVSIGPAPSHVPPPLPDPDPLLDWWHLQLAVLNPAWKAAIPISREDGRLVVCIQDPGPRAHLSLPARREAAIEAMDGVEELEIVATRSVYTDRKD